MKSTLRTVIVLAAAFLAVGILSAAERVHVVAPGESAVSLAKKYYGNKDLADLLMRFNGRAGNMIHPGDRLTIPSCAAYKAKAGDTWSELAKRHLGRAGAANVLAELNGYTDEEPLKVGTPMVVPVVMHYTLARGETLSDVAQRYYGNSSKAAIVQEFSKIDDVKKLAVGTELEIPLIAFVRAETAAGKSEAKPQAVAAIKKPAEPSKPVEKVSAPPAPEPATAAALPAPPPALPAPAPTKFDGPLAAAARSFVDGEYDHAREMLETLREPVTREGSVSERREWARLMAFVYIALDRDADACKAYRSVPPADWPAGFDPDVVSPRIRGVLAACPAADPSVSQLDKPEAGPQISSHGGTQR